MLRRPRVLAGVIVAGVAVFALWTFLVHPQIAKHQTPPGSFARNGWSGSPVDQATQVALTTMSCATTTFCIAVDQAAGTATVWNGSSWSTPAAVDVGNKVTGVSCWSATNCFAVDDHGNFLTWDGSAWSRPTAIDSGSQTPVMAAPPLRPGCTSIQFCGAPAGVYARTPVSTGSTAQPSLMSISCPAYGLCVAIDNQGNTLTQSMGIWQPAAPTDVNAAQFSSLSCTTDRFCAAVDGQGNAVTWDGHTWTSPQGIDGKNSLTSVSCASLAFCAAVDSNGNVVIRQSGWWLTPKNVDPGKRLTSIACPSAAACVAGDSAGNEVTWDGTQWSLPTAITSNGAGITTISCTSPTQCIAADTAGNSLKGSA